MTKLTSAAAAEEMARRIWENKFEDQAEDHDASLNRSSIAIIPIYRPDDWEMIVNLEKLEHPEVGRRCGRCANYRSL